MVACLRFFVLMHHSGQDTIVVAPQHQPWREASTPPLHPGQRGQAGLLPDWWGAPYPQEPREAAYTKPVVLSELRHRGLRLARGGGHCGSHCQLWWRQPPLPRASNALPSALAVGQLGAAPMAQACALGWQPLLFGEDSGKQHH